MLWFKKKTEEQVPLYEIVAFYKEQIERIQREAQHREETLRDEVLYYRDAYERLAMARQLPEERSPVSTLEDMADEDKVTVDPSLYDEWNRVHGEYYFLAPLDKGDKGMTDGATAGN